ncbi:putative F-box/kelch-repeat protein KMD1/2 [Helianthus debilis subsp. tardiflorus]
MQGLESQWRTQKFFVEVRMRCSTIFSRGVAAHPSQRLGPPLWKAEVHLPELLRLRNSTGKAQSLVVLSQAKVNPAGKRKCLDVPVYRLVVFGPETGSWSEIPCLPDFENGRCLLPVGMI